MTALLQAILLPIVGCCLLLYARQAYIRGEIRAGSNFFRPFRPNRYENPFTFYFFLGIYLLLGVFIIGQGVLIGCGIVEPMPLR